MAASVGCTVVLKNLSGAAHLNGKTGTVLAWVPEKERYRVGLADGNSEVLVKQANLQVSGAGESEAGSAGQPIDIDADASAPPGAVPGALGSSLASMGGGYAKHKLATAPANNNSTGGVNWELEQQQFDISSRAAAVRQQRQQQMQQQQQQHQHQQEAQQAGVSLAGAPPSFHPDPHWLKYKPDTVIECDAKTPEGLDVKKKMLWRDYCTMYEEQMRSSFLEQQAPILPYMTYKPRFYSLTTLTSNSRRGRGSFTPRPSSVSSPQTCRGI